MKIEPFRRIETAPVECRTCAAVSQDALPAVQPLPFAVVLKRLNQRWHPGENSASPGGPPPEESIAEASGPGMRSSVLSELLWRRSRW